MKLSRIDIIGQNGNTGDHYCWPCDKYSADGCELGKRLTPMSCNDFQREPGHDLQEAIDAGLVDELSDTERGAGGFGSTGA